MSGPRVLFISGSIGLGHAARDLAIAGELRRLDPAIEIDWLAGDPARRLIEDARECWRSRTAPAGPRAASAAQPRRRGQKAPRLPATS